MTEYGALRHASTLSDLGRAGQAYGLRGSFSDDLQDRIDDRFVVASRTEPPSVSLLVGDRLG
jgi:hypothetical protein